MLLIRLLTLVAVGLPFGAARAQVRPEVSFGISAQNDQGIKRVNGVEQSRFQLSPVGIVTGIGLQRVDNRTGTISMGANVAVFPLLYASTVTDVIGGASLQKASFLILGSVSADWAPRAVIGATGWPWFLTVGATHALASPRSGTRNAFTAGAGVRHRLKAHADLKGAIELLAPSIGETFFQIPLTVSIHR